MPKYTPLTIEPAISCGKTTMVFMASASFRLVADFVIPDDEEQLLRIRFDSIQIARVLDEMPLHTEEGIGEGIVPHHFGYLVEGSRFWNSQSEAMTMAPYAEALRHYRFFTGETCLDVIANREPRFEIVNADDESERADGFFP